MVIWSVTSGKRQILMDGREVHYSANRVGILDFSWNTKGSHVLKVTCHAAPPLSATPGFRQYDMFIDGQSFFNMPKVYELGVRGVAAVDNRQPVPYGGGGYDSNFSPRSSYSGVGGGYERDDSSSFRVPRSSTEEDEELQRAIRASLEESKRHLKEASPPDVLDSAPAPAPDTTDLLDFGGPEPSLPAIMPDASATYGAPALPPTTTPFYDAGYGAPPPSQPPAYDGGYAAAALPPAQYGAPPPPAAYGAPPPAYGAPPQQQYLALPSSQPMPPSQPPAYGAPQLTTGPPAYGAPSAPAYGASPQPSYASAGTGTQFDDPFAPKPPTFHDTANDILKNYGPSATTPSSAMTSGRYQPGQPFFAESPSAPPPPQNYMSPPAYETPQQQQVNGNHGMGGTPLTMEKLAIADEEEPKNPFDAALKKLVNIDHIDEPAEEKLRLTMKKQEDEKAKKNKGKSVPLPPVAQRKLGSGATLGEISQVKPQQEKKSVMQPPPGLFQGDPAMYGALVVHGQGPPPLQPQGFGVVHMQSQIQAQRQYMYGAPSQFQQYSQQQPPPPQQQQQPQPGYGYR